MGSHREHGEHRGKTVRDSFLSEKEKTCQTKVRRSQESGDRGVVKITYPAITSNGHRGVSASSFRDGAIPFLERNGADRGVVKITYPAITSHGHRGVNAPFFHDGAIAFLERHRTDRGVVKITYPAITYKVRRSQAQHRGVSAPSFRDGAIRSLEG